MFLRRRIVLNAVLVLLLLITACSSTSPPPSNDAQLSREAAAAAFANLEGGSNTFGQTVTPPSQEMTQMEQSILSLERPVWVDSPEMAYNRNQYIIGRGQGTSQDLAERNALANLTAFFGQSVQVDQTITNTYFEAVRSGVTTDWIDDFSMQNTVRTRTTMDALIGAEIREIWHDTRGNTFYALAVMDRATTAQIYADMIRANQVMIGNLINIPDEERSSLFGYSRFLFAAVVADVNVTYSNLLSVIGIPFSGDIVNGNAYRLESQNIAHTIPIGVRVVNDRSGRIQGAFARVFSELGFRSGGSNERYVCEVIVNFSPVELANNPNQFVRIELSANLTDTNRGIVLLPWNFNERHGHLNVSEAENRAIAGAERKIQDEYGDYLSSYLARMIQHR